MPRKGTKHKRQIAKPALRSQRTSKKPRSIPDPPEMTACSHSLGKQYPLNNTSTTKAPTAPHVSTHGSSARFTTEGAARQSLKPVTNRATSQSIPKLAINPKAPVNKGVMENSLKDKKEIVDKEPENKNVSASVKKINQQKDTLPAKENSVPLSPLSRLRKNPRRLERREPENEPQEKSIFEVISRDSLQRYMAHYDIPKRQDLKKNLVMRVHAHFDTIDHSEINLEELMISVRARWRQLDEEAAEKGKK